MIHVEYDETNNKVKLQIEGCLGQIWAELGLVIKKIADYGNLEMSVDEVFDAIKESIEWNTKKHKTEIVS